MANTALLVFLSLCIVLLFAVMVTSSIAANNADSGTKCHDYSMYSALITGLTTLLLIIGIGVYIYTSREAIVEGMTEHTGNLHDYLKSLKTPAE